MWRITDGEKSIEDLEKVMREVYRTSLTTTDRTPRHRHWSKTTGNALASEEKLSMTNKRTPRNEEEINEEWTISEDVEKNCGF
ncbi:hypothetical protein JTB14_005430 [Gonioctena quinquepunctata]|nr:hypothetical protein JTB14_005430 [Gonioctena quinquepunctata]